ncbi:MAG: YqhA family protein [Atopobiaceae bacterium]|jgi:uncharacterized membrane protein YqhA
MSEKDQTSQASELPRESDVAQTSSVDSQRAPHAGEEALDAASTDTGCAGKKSAQKERLYKSVHGAIKLATWGQIVSLLPAGSLFLMSITLSLMTMFRLFHLLLFTVLGEYSLLNMAVEFVEFTDFFLLATVLYITSLGLFKLFVYEKIKLPKWLSFQDFDDLKERLVGVVVVMIAVFFLGEVLREESPGNLLMLGGSISLVICSLAVYIKLVYHASHKVD